MSTAPATASRDLVVGLGATGLSVARFLRRSAIDAVFFDSRKQPPGIQELDAVWPDAEVRLGDTQIPAGVQRVIASPGIADSHPVLTRARQEQLEIISDIELFARAAEAPFVAVTGSNGKSTVTTLLCHMCRADGRNALAGGNLGEPALDLLDKPKPDIYVLELSSFQLQRTQSLPASVAVLLNVSPDHLDWHSSEAEYRRAKYRIFREANSAVINRADPEAVRQAATLDRVISFGSDAPAAGQYGLRSEGGVTFLARGEKPLLAVGDLAMYGIHNQLNALAALAAGELLGLGHAAMLQVLAEFPGLPHRMQLVARIAGVDYINDSKATNVAAAVASIQSIDGKLVLIAGGDGKGADFTDLAAAVEGKLRAAVLIGADAEKIAAGLDTVMPVHFARSLTAAVRTAATLAERDDTVLLAPACASFDQFANYLQRGNVFCEAVGALQ